MVLKTLDLFRESSLRVSCTVDHLADERVLSLQIVTREALVGAANLFEALVVVAHDQ